MSDTVVSTIETKSGSKSFEIKLDGECTGDCVKFSLDRELIKIEVSVGYDGGWGYTQAFATLNRDDIKKVIRSLQQMQKGLAKGDLFRGHD